jgi:enolase-phosphatase E1
LRAVLTDIEGTTTALTFVHDILFPISSAQMESFVRKNWDTNPHIKAVKDEISASSVDAVVEVLRKWIKEDRKHRDLKAIQGQIWKSGFESGELKGHVYPDVAENFKKWSSAGIRIFIFSSGSAEAQKMIFRHSTSGDLSSYISGYFDTTVGAKKESASYQNIAKAIGLQPAEVLFLSDVVIELDAAQAAGMRTTHLNRDFIVSGGSHASVNTFDQISL